MDVGFVNADSTNLPRIDTLMIWSQIRRQQCYRCVSVSTSILCGDLTKKIESINAGIVLCDNVLHAEKTKSGRNVFILQRNRKNVELPSRNTQGSFENCKNTCPRCIDFYKRAKRLLENISRLGKKKSLGVCSNCGVAKQTDPSHCKCNVIFEKFLTSLAKDLDIDGHNIKTSHEKPNRLIKFQAENNWVKLQKHSYSDSYLSRGSKNYFEQITSHKPTDRHQVQIKPLIQSETDLSKLYITQTSQSFLQEEKELRRGQQASPTRTYHKTRLRIRKQSHDWAFQFHFIFPSEKKHLDSKLQVSSSQLLHDIQANSKTNTLKNKTWEEQRRRILEKKNFGAKTNKQTLPWPRDFTILSSQGNSLGHLHDIRAKYRGSKTLEDKILEERRSRALETINFGEKTNNQTLPWQRDFSLFSLEGKAIELLNDIRAKYRGIKILEKKILEKKNLGAKTSEHLLPWQRDFSLLRLEGNSLDLPDIRGKYRKTKILEDKILAERRSSDLEIGEKANKLTLPLQRDSSLLSLKENSLELLNDILVKYEKRKIHLQERLVKDLDTKSIGTKTKKHRFSWQKDYSLLNVVAKYEEKKSQLQRQRNRDFEKSSLLNLEAKYQDKKINLEEQRNRDLEKNTSGVKTKKHGLPWQKDSSFANLEVKYGEKQKHLEEQRSRDLKKKPLGVKTKNHELPWQKDSSLLNLKVKYENNKIVKRRSKDLDQKKNGIKTKDNGLPWQKNPALLHLEAKHEKKESHLEAQRKSDLDKKTPDAKTKKHSLPSQKDYSLLNLDAKYEENQRHLEMHHSRNLEKKKLGAKPNKYKLPWQKEPALLDLEEETATTTFTQANLIKDEQMNKFKKKKQRFHKKDDNFNEINDDNNEKSNRLVKKIHKILRKEIKKKQAILEILTKMDGNNVRVIRLTLSHQKFLDMEWAELSTGKAVRKMNIYRMRLSRPEFDWFAKNKHKRKIFYDSGETLAEFSEDGRGRWFYRNGKLALDYYNTEKSTPGKRYVVYSSGKPDRKGLPRPQTILASFDHSGNAVVFDHIGNIRLKYDQSEGVVLDPSIGPMSHWKWHSLDDSQIHIEENGLRKENEPTDNEHFGLHDVELKKSVQEKKSKKSYKPFEIKMKALKINETFSLKILDQAKVYLIYRDGTTHIKINLGMTLNRTEIVDTETCNVGEVFNPLEKFPADTESILALQRTLAQTREAERARLRRRGRLTRSLFVG